MVVPGPRAGRPRLVEAGLVTDEAFSSAMAQVQGLDFVMLSTTSLAVLGRRPATPA